ncbi:MAG: hypothetical protein R3324_19310, partial [Halobacteriales archaeon]|nr:hypothetical protein [Halobacteriales archaeon]
GGRPTPTMTTTTATEDTMSTRYEVTYTDVDLSKLDDLSEPNALVALELAEVQGLDFCTEDESDDGKEWNFYDSTVDEWELDDLDESGTPYKGGADEAFKEVLACAGLELSKV